MRFDTKIAIAARAGLAVRQQLNVTAFLAGLAPHGPRNVVDKVPKGVTLHP